ncbi:hypothetical protein GCM10009555_106370 [Acrocarpospora macrocephala]|uniref:SAF domain-containing protein n=2 Tax=Acrocarpospora TaxID=90974 RepID=A0A5M3XVV5_9ACTN|nr:MULTISPECIES: hypothetical protein [Acrocarpospora]GES15381.1 hypothetical protein Amac_089780 [Acrocarpospora macrocephala]GES23463.1 hypothetical protein Aple_063620 [Acrocarpospora pleiomorpha]
MRISEKPARESRTGPVERPGLSGPAARKLPVPPRERKPALAALAVLLILGGALATTLLVLRSGDRVSAVRIIEQVGAGEKIPASALQEVQIAETGIDYVAWRFRDKVLTTYASVTLLPGTLLTENMTSTASEQLGPGKAQVGLALKSGQAPIGLTKGDIVQVIYVPAAGRGTAATQQRVLAQNALVHSVGAPGRTATGLVTVIVDEAVSPTVAQYASSGEIALAVLPGAR